MGNCIRLIKFNFFHMAVESFQKQIFWVIVLPDFRIRQKRTRFNLISFPGNRQPYSTIAAKFINSMQGTQRPATNNPRLMMFYCLVQKQRTPGNSNIFLIFCHIWQKSDAVTFYTPNVCRDLQGLCRGFLQYLQGKSCNIYRFSLQFLQSVNIAGKICKYYRVFLADIAENPCRVPVNPCKHLQCTFDKKFHLIRNLTYPSFTD